MLCSLTRDGRNGSITPAAAIEHFADLAAMGIDQAIFSMPNVYDLEPFDLLATEIIPVVENIQVAGRLTITSSSCFLPLLLVYRVFRVALDAKHFVFFSYHPA